MCILEHDLFVFIEMAAFLVISSFPSKEALISLLEIVLFMQQILPLKLLEITSYVTWTDGVWPFFFSLSIHITVWTGCNHLSAHLQRRQHTVRSLTMKLIYSHVGMLTPVTNHHWAAVIIIMLIKDFPRSYKHSKHYAHSEMHIISCPSSCKDMNMAVFTQGVGVIICSSGVKVGVWECLWDQTDE